MMIQPLWWCGSVEVLFEKFSVAKASGISCQVDDYGRLKFKAASDIVFKARADKSEGNV